MAVVVGAGGNTERERERERERARPGGDAVREGDQRKGGREGGLAVGR